MPAVKILTALPERELRELIREVLEHLKIGFSEFEGGFYTDLGIIRIFEREKTHFGLRLHEILVPDEHIANEIRKRLKYKRAGG